MAEVLIVLCTSLIYFERLVKELKEQEEKLKSEKNRVQENVNEAKRHNQTQLIAKNVLDWLTKADIVLDDVQSLKCTIQENNRCFCWPYPLSKKIEEKKLAIRKLVKSSSTFHIMQFFESKSSVSAFDKIMEAMKENVKMIGICGMAGVGKTTLVAAVANKVKEFQPFHQVITVDVSQRPDIRKIQVQIAAFLDLKFQKKTQEEKAKELKHRLEKEEKVLIIFDDAWNDLNFREIGIPSGKNCKIILTTRRRSVCASMNSKVTVSLSLLDKEEAWTLFKMNASSLDNASREIIGVAKKVAEECGGLPLAIVTLARALRSADLSQWQSALSKLKRSNLMDIENVQEDEEKNAYLSLEKSYNHLQSQETKKCFLLCGLHLGQDSIDVEDLVRYAWSLRLYQNAVSIEEVRIQVHEAINDLKDSFLLLEDNQKGFIKMHNVVGQFARWIEYKEGNGILQKPEDEISKRGLKILLLDNYDSRTYEGFEEMQELQFLSLRTTNEYCFFSLSALESLKNLRALQLKGFKQLEDISALEKLMTLEILSLCNSEFQEPKESETVENKEENLDKFGGLKDLRVLDIRKCNFLLRFPPGVIRKLVKVEELYLYYPTVERSGSGDILPELNSLSALALLVMEISFRLSKGFVFGKSPKRYRIAINRAFQTDSTAISSRFLTISKRIPPLNVISQFLRYVEVLHLSNIETDIQCLTDTTLQSLQDVKIDKCQLKSLEDLQWIGQITNEENQGPLLSNLKKLCLLNLPVLECIWENPVQHISLRSLEAVKLNNCGKLVSLFSFSLALSLKCLEELEIYNCGKLKQIVDVEESASFSLWFPKLRSLEIHNCDNLEYIFRKFTRLPKLQKLSLVHLSRLTQICPTLTEQMEGNDEYYFSSLMELKLIDCPKLTGIGIHSKVVQPNLKILFLTNAENQLCKEIIQVQGGYLLSGLEKLMLMELTDFQFISEDPFQIVPLHYLSHLHVFNCKKLRHIFSLHLSRNLPLLKHLEVYGCEELEQAIVEFPVSLPSMVRQNPVYFPNLEEILIRECNRLKRLFPITASRLPKLKKLVVLKASNLREVFGHDSTEANMMVTQNQILLPRLEILILQDLPKLNRFSSVCSNFELPALNVLRVDKYPCSQFMRFCFLHDSEDSYVRVETDHKEGKEDSSFTKQYIQPTPELIMEWEKPRQFRQR